MPVINDSCDVLVVGGGTAGVVAAIQSARAGAETLLLEMSSQLGGTITNCGMCYPSYFNVGGRQIVGGIGWELVRECVELSNGSMPDWNNPPPHRPSYSVKLNPGIYALLAEEKALASGVRIAFHEIPESICRMPDGWRVASYGKMLRRNIRAKEIIDCSGDASAVRLAGGPCVREETIQPGTLVFHLDGYDPDRLDADTLEAAYQKALTDGELERGDFCFSDRPFHYYLKNRGGNLQHIFEADSSDSSTLTAANVAGRQRLLKMIRFLRRQPGLEHCTLADCPPMIGIRESYRIVGETVITEDDYFSGKHYSDALAYTYFYVDIHNHDGIEYKFLPPGIFPTLPLSALIPKGMEHMLTAGRTVSSDRSAFSALRVQASCMAMGQMAGAAAALAARYGVTPGNMQLEDIRKLLLKHDAVVPDISKRSP